MAKKAQTDIRISSVPRHHIILPIVAFLLGMVVTIGVARSFQIHEKKSLEAAFEDQADTIVQLIDRRMSEYIQILRGGQALFAASANVSREEWQQYYTALRLPKQLPGIQAFAYSMFLRTPEDIAAIEASTRASGYPDFTVWPDPTQRNEVHAITYIEPMDERNRQAFGYDMGSEPIRKKAMTRARDTGEPALSGKVRLVQEITEEVQAGTLLYVPIYQNGTATRTLSEKHNSLKGFVYAAFRMGDLISAILKAQNIPGLGITISDETAHFTGDSSVLYDSRTQEQQEHPSLTTVRKLELAGTTWYIHIAADTVYAKTTSKQTSLVILITGLVISSLLSLLFVLITRTQAKASQIAYRMTGALQQNKNRLRAIYSISATGSLSMDEQIQKMLDLGAKELNLDAGTIGTVEQEIYTTIFVSSGSAEIRGEATPLPETYCSISMSQDDVVAIHHFSASEYRDHRCFERHRFESYIGSKVMVNGKVYGVVSFHSSKIKSEPFSDEDLEFIRLISRFIGGAIERKLSLESLEKQRDELQKTNDLMFGREIVMKELKAEINRLKNEK